MRAFKTTSKIFVTIYVSYCLLNSIISIMLPFIFNATTHIMAHWLITFGVIMIGTATRINVKYIHIEIFVDVLPFLWILIGIVIGIGSNINESENIIIATYIIMIINTIVIGGFLLAGVLNVEKKKDGYTLIY